MKASVCQVIHILPEKRNSLEFLEDAGLLKSPTESISSKISRQQQPVNTKSTEVFGNLKETYTITCVEDSISLKIFGQKQKKLSTPAPVSTLKFTEPKHVTAFLKTEFPTPESTKPIVPFIKLHKSAKSDVLKIVVMPEEDTEVVLNYSFSPRGILIF